MRYTYINLIQIWEIIWHGLSKYAAIDQYINIIVYLYNISSTQQTYIPIGINRNIVVYRLKLLNQYCT